MCQDINLGAVLDLLREDAVVVAEAVAVGGHAEGGHGVEEAGGEAAEATVAQAEIVLVFDDLQHNNVVHLE